MSGLDTPLFTFGETTLYKADLDTLEPGCWLNDKMIDFYWEYVHWVSTPLVHLSHRQKLRLYFQVWTEEQF